MNERLKEVRKHLKLSQDEFGKRLGIGKSAVSRMESGDYGITPPIERLIIKEFGVNSDWFHDGSGEMFKEIDKENQLMEWAGEVLADESDSFRRRFVNMLMNLKDEDWEHIEKYLDMLQKKS